MKRSQMLLVVALLDFRANSFLHLALFLKKKREICFDFFVARDFTNIRETDTKNTQTENNVNHTKCCESVVATT